MASKASMESQQVILVDAADNVTGYMEKLEAHQKGLLHRAFSVFVFNKSNEMLLQQRAVNKYHSPGIWSNTCCSHPYPGENLNQAAERRLYEEMGFNIPLLKAFDFVYKVQFENGLTEHEFDHVFVGRYNGIVSPNPNEVQDFDYKSMSAIHQELETEPEKYTVWFRIAFPKLEEWLSQHAARHP